MLHINRAVLRLFSTRQNFLHAAEFFFVCELSGRTNRKKTKKNCVVCVKFCLVENGLNTFSHVEQYTISEGSESELIYGKHFHHYMFLQTSSIFIPKFHISVLSIYMQVLQHLAFYLYPHLPIRKVNRYIFECKYNPYEIKTLVSHQQIPITERE